MNQPWKGSAALRPPHGRVGGVHRILRIAVALSTSACVLCGCSGQASTTTGAASSAPTPTTVASSTLTAQRVVWKPLLTLPQLGEFKTRCTKTRFAVSFTAALATEKSIVWLDDVRQETLTLQPGETRYTPLLHVQQQRWKITQGTEPQTIAAIVRVSPARCPYGIPTTSLRYATAHYNSR
jgi:hypothetical protein